jgi:hypothetical protein
MGRAALQKEDDVRHGCADLCCMNQKMPNRGWAALTLEFSAQDAFDRGHAGWRK